MGCCSSADKQISELHEFFEYKFDIKFITTIYYKCGQDWTKSCNELNKIKKMEFENRQTTEEAKGNTVDSEIDKSQRENDEIKPNQAANIELGVKVHMAEVYDDAVLKQYDIDAMIKQEVKLHINRAGQMDTNQNHGGLSLPLPMSSPCCFYDTDADSIFIFGANEKNKIQKFNKTISNSNWETIGVLPNKPFGRQAICKYGDSCIIIGSEGSKRAYCINYSDNIANVVETGHGHGKNMGATLIESDGNTYIIISGGWYTEKKVSLLCTKQWKIIHSIQTKKLHLGHASVRSPTNVNEIILFGGTVQDLHQSFTTIKLENEKLCEIDNDNNVQRIIEKSEKYGIITDFGLGLIDKGCYIMVGGYNRIEDQAFDSLISIDLNLGNIDYLQQKLPIALSCCGVIVDKEKCIHVIGGETAYGQPLNSHYFLKI